MWFFTMRCLRKTHPGPYFSIPLPAKRELRGGNNWYELSVPLVGIAARILHR
jgi:hypothetical protein